MNAAPVATHTLTPATSMGPSVADLEDLLYDILATGADPNLPAGTLEAVQLFVHEHARSKKSRAEFLAFFEARALPLRPASPALLALPPIEMRGRAAESPELMVIAQPPDPPLTASAANGGKRTWALAAACAVLTGLAGFGCFAALEMREEFAHARAQAARNAAALSNVRAEAETLRAAMRQNAQVMQRVEHKSDLLLQSMASPLDPSAR
jgi:hypothetical protein